MKCWFKKKKKSQAEWRLFSGFLQSSKSVDEDWLVLEVMWDTVIPDISRHKLNDSLTIQTHTNLFSPTDFSSVIVKTSICVFGQRYSVCSTNDFWQLYNPPKAGHCLLCSLGSCPLPHRITKNRNYIHLLDCALCSSPWQDFKLHLSLRSAEMNSFYLIKADLDCQSLIFKKI